MSDEKIIDFKSKEEENLIKFDPEFINNDGYLKLSCFNALEKAGYFISPAGVKAFQEDMNLEQTGIIDPNTMTLLIQVFDNDKIQDILTHFDRENAKFIEENRKAKKRKNRRIVGLIIWGILLIFFECYGWYSFVYDALRWTHVLK